MQTSENPPPQIKAVQITPERLAFELMDGRTISVPLACYPTLLLASDEERANYEIAYTSVYWPDLDCDIDAEALLRGAKERRAFAAKAYERAALRRGQAA